jgi:hypothetical protein
VRHEVAHPSLSPAGETGYGPTMTVSEGEMGSHEDDRVEVTAGEVNGHTASMTSDEQDPQMPARAKRRS